MPSDRIRLLVDCRTAFRSAGVTDNQGRPAIPSSVLLDKLRSDPEAPWAEYGKTGGGLTAMKLGQLLAEYEIRSSNIRFGPPHGQVKGYYQADFDDAWHRYCPDPDQTPEGEPSQPSQPSPPSSTPDGSYPWDGLSRPTPPTPTPPLGRLKPSQPSSRPALTSNGTAGTAGTATPRPHGHAERPLKSPQPYRPTPTHRKPPDLGPTTLSTGRSTPLCGDTSHFLT